MNIKSRLTVILVIVFLSVCVVSAYAQQVLSPYQSPSNAHEPPIGPYVRVPVPTTSDNAEYPDSEYSDSDEDVSDDNSDASPGSSTDGQVDEIVPFSPAKQDQDNFQPGPLPGSAWNDGRE